MAAAARAVRRSGGQVNSELWLINAVEATLPAGRLVRLTAQPGLVSIVDNKGVTASQTPDLTGWDGWITDRRFPVPWDGSPDAQPIPETTQYDVVYPLPIDLGTDRLGVTGLGVTVAVVDSGVYFSRDMFNSDAAFAVYALRFRGQADFANPVCATQIVKKKTQTIGVQFRDYCQTVWLASKDPYGHGSHVTGILWNLIQDNDTGISLGVAPLVNILSVRVLGANGTGTYASVIKGIQYVVAKRALLQHPCAESESERPRHHPLLRRPAQPGGGAGLGQPASWWWPPPATKGRPPRRITVPGNDPYVITVGALDGRRTPGYWGDDILAARSATGPTLDGFVKPDSAGPGHEHRLLDVQRPQEPRCGPSGADSTPDYSKRRLPLPHERHQHGHGGHLGSRGADAASPTRR